MSAFDAALLNLHEGESPKDVAAKAELRAKRAAKREAAERKKDGHVPDEEIVKDGLEVDTSKKEGAKGIKKWAGDLLKWK